MVERDDKGRWLSGESPNPGGRPVGSVSLRTLLQEKLQEVNEAGDGTLAGDIVASTFKAAMEGDPQARKLVWEYIDGKAPQSISITGADGGPIRVNMAEVVDGYEDEAEAALENEGEG